MATIPQIIEQYAQQYNIPAWIPETIAYKESGWNPGADVVDTNGAHSTGLFQLNQKGVGAGHAPSQLKDPSLNAAIAIPNMVPAYQAGLSQGLSGFDLVAYTANNSAWPGNIGVNSVQAQAYDYQGSDSLLNAYKKVTGGTADPSGGMEMGKVAEGGGSNAPSDPAGNGLLYQIASMEHMQSFTDWTSQHSDVSALQQPFEYAFDQTKAVGFRSIIILVGLVFLVFALIEMLPSQAKQAAVTAAMIPK